MFPRRVWVVAGGAALWLACASAASAGLPDTWVTAKVKMALLTSAGVGGPINVDTDEGRVTLHGAVATLDQKREADRVASEVTGVREVRNLLQVVPPSRKKEVRTQDASLERRVKDAIAEEPNLSEVKVKSVHRGFVLLGGKTEHLSDHLQALELVANVEGVRQVASDVQVSDPSEERDLESPEDSASSRANDSRHDSWITTQTKLRLMTDPDLAWRDIHVDTRRGRVVLFGSVPKRADRETAARLAASVTGVRGVQDELEIVSTSTDRSEAKVEDEAIAEAVRRRLADAALVGATIDVDVQTSIARLTGSVQNETDRATALKIATSTEGVTSVRDGLRVEPAASSAR